HTADSFTGLVNDQPLNLPNVRLGQSVSVPLDRVSDWLAVDQGHLIGGYTIRLLRSRMDAKERQQYDAQLGAVIEWVEMMTASDLRSNPRINATLARRSC